MKKMSAGKSNQIFMSVRSSNFYDIEFINMGRFSYFVIIQIDNYRYLKFTPNI